MTREDVMRLDAKAATMGKALNLNTKVAMFEGLGRIALPNETIIGLHDTINKMRVMNQPNLINEIASANKALGSLMSTGLLDSISKINSEYNSLNRCINGMHCRTSYELSNTAYGELLEMEREKPVGC